MQSEIGHHMVYDEVMSIVVKRTKTATEKIPEHGLKFEGTGGIFLDLRLSDAAQYRASSWKFVLDSITLWRDSCMKEMCGLTFCIGCKDRMRKVEVAEGNFRQVCHNCKVAA